MHNQQIIHWFELLIRQIQYDIDTKKGKERLQHSYRLKSIRNSVKQIKKFKKKINSGKDLKDLSGIGRGTVLRIDEILETGRLEEVDQAFVSGTYLKYIEELEEVFGIGRTIAIDLYTNYMIRSIDDLRKAVSNQTITLPDHVVKGIYWHDRLNLRIPRREVDDTYIEILEYCLKIDPDINCIVCGSYRREELVMGDIDIIITHSQINTLDESRNSDLLERVINYMIEKKFILDNLTATNVRTKFMGICRSSIDRTIVRRIDIRFIPTESYYTAILYFTGSKDFNRTMRSVAKDMGYTLNEYHLLDRSMNIIPINSEFDIFDKLGMEYMVPRLRS